MEKPAIVLLHGALGAAALYKEKLNQETAEQFFIPDLPGHGEAVLDEFPSNIQAFSDWLAQYLESHNLTQVCILGYSMGGYIALNLAVTRPDLISGIVTLGTKFSWDEAIASKEASRLNSAKIAEKVPHFANHLASLHGDSWPLVVDRTSGVLLHLGHTHLTDAALSKVKAKVIICRGSNDNMVVDDESQHVASVIPSAAYHVLPDVPHPLDQVSADTIRALIAHFQ